MIQVLQFAVGFIVGSIVVLAALWTLARAIAALYFIGAWVYRRIERRPRA